MKMAVSVAVAVVIVILIGGVAALAMWDLPAPVNHVNKVLSNESWQK
jgi:hypothetical protein